MGKIEEAASIVAEYLLRHRYIPPERDGWFSSYEIQKGIRDEHLGHVRSGRLFPALGYLEAAQPPAIESAWIACDDKYEPIVDSILDEYIKEENSRRFYRALGNAHNYVELELPSTNLNPAF